MRVFIAIPLNNKTKQKLYTIQTKYQKTFFQKVVWLKPDNLHLTLKFIGEIKPEQLEILHKILNSFKESLIKENFYLTVTNLMPTDNPKIIYAEIKSNNLIKVMKKIDEVLFQFPSSKYYKPHITLGRIKSNLNKLDVVKIKKFKIDLSEKFECFILYQSISSTQGTIYKPLKKYLI